MSDLKVSELGAAEGGASSEAVPAVETVPSSTEGARLPDASLRARTADHARAHAQLLLWGTRAM